MTEEERFDEEIDDLEPAAEEAEDVKGGLNFTMDPTNARSADGSVMPTDQKSFKNQDFHFNQP